MNKLFGYTNAYVERSDWKDFALVKLCLCAAGIIIGCLSPERYKKPVIAVSSMVFISTYALLIGKLIKVIGED